MGWETTSPTCPWFSCYDRYTSPPQTVRKLCECCSTAKKKLRGLMYQVLGWVKSSTELYQTLPPFDMGNHPNPFLASRLQCVSPYDPVRDRQVKKKNQGAVEQKGCSLVSTDEEHHSQRPKVTLQTWQKVFQKAAAWLGANHLPLTFYLFIYPSILTIHPSIYWMFVYMYYMYIFLPIMPICAHPAHPKKQAKSTNMEII